MLHLNRVRGRAVWVQLNELTDEQAEKVFDDLPPCSHDDEGTQQYEESVVDRKIERVRFADRVGKNEVDAIHQSIVVETIVELMKGIAACRGTAAVHHDPRRSIRHRKVVGTRELAISSGYTQTHIRRLTEKMPARCKVEKNGRFHGFYEAEAQAWLKKYKAS